MTIYVDPPREQPTKLRHKVWSHMVSDQGPEELHEMARRIGLKREWSQEPPKASQHHYDVTPRYRDKAIACGAKAVTSRELTLRSYDGLHRRRQIAKKIGDKIFEGRGEIVDETTMVVAISKDRDLGKSLPDPEDVSLLVHGVLAKDYPNLTAVILASLASQ